MSIVKSFSVGEGDMYYIVHNTDNFTVIDCCYSTVDEWARQLIEIERLRKNKGVCRFISTHPDEDHIKGLKEYNSKFGIINFYCVKNEATKPDETDNFEEYKKLRDDTQKAFYLFKGCSRRWMNQSNDERGSSGIQCLWPVISNKYFQKALESAKEGKSYNNISPIITYSVENSARFMWLGDLETTFLENIEEEVDFSHVDIVFAPHHGRKSGHLPKSILDKITPRIIIVGEAPSSDLDYYQGYNTITQNSSGSIVFDCHDNHVDIYVGNENYSVNFLEDKSCPDYYGNYIGTLVLN